jgi:Rps23 Pro-64 3,4-dihydroxylase Tpa1-like proline 4-hydroxylase
VARARQRRQPLQRKLNVIIYLTPMYQESWGGHLGFWSDHNGEPGELVKEVAPLFNRVVIFDTTQMSWHGMSRKLKLPPAKYRRSVAVYYLCKPAYDVDKRGRALFAPRAEQRGDAAVAQFIQERSR